MTEVFATYPGAGGASSANVPVYANLASFPSAASAGDGALAIALDTNILYESDGANWVVLADPTYAAAITSLTGDVTGTGPGAAATTIANLAVTTAKINALAVTNAKIANGTIDLTSKVTGVLPVANGGTNSATALNNNRVMQSSGGAVVEAAAITASRALASDANGIPVASATTAAQLAFSSNVTSDIQTQINSKQASGNYITALTGNVTASGPGSVAATIANLAVTNAMIANGTIDLTAKVTGILPTANGGTGQNSTATFPTSGVVVTEAASEVLTNKTINGASNTLTVRAASDITGQLPIANGGTAAATANAGFNNLAPTTTKGDLIVYSGGVNARIGVGGDNQIVIADSAQTPGIRWGVQYSGNYRGSEGGGTVTLTNADKQEQTFNLTSAETVKLPTTGVLAGDIWTIRNPNAFVLTIQSSGANTIIKSNGTGVKLQANTNTPTTAGHWTVIGKDQLMGTSSTAYTPTLTGVGTVTNLKAFWTRHWSNIVIPAVWTNGTVSAAALTMTLPTGLNIFTTNITDTESGFGMWVQLTNGAQPMRDTFGVCYYRAAAGSNVVQFAYQVASLIYTGDNANNFMGTGGTVNVLPLTIPISEWQEA